MNNEIWKQIKGFENVFEISNLGNVKRLKCRWAKNDRILKPNVGKRGYFVVNLSLKGFNKVVTIHRLVAIAFIPNPKNKREVNHKDGNKQNNSIENLEWVTPSENSRHAIKSQHIKKFNKPRGSHLEKGKWVSSIRFDKNLIYLGRYKTKTEAQQKYYEKFKQLYGFNAW